MFEEENGRKHPKFSNLLFLSKIHIFSRSFVRQKNKVRLKKLLVLFTQSKCSLVAYQKEHGCLQGRCVLWFYLMLCMAAGNHPFKKRNKTKQGHRIPHLSRRDNGILFKDKEPQAHSWFCWSRSLRRILSTAGHRSLNCRTTQGAEAGPALGPETPESMKDAAVLLAHRCRETPGVC